MSDAVVNHANPAPFAQVALEKAGLKLVQVGWERKHPNGTMLCYHDWDVANHKLIDGETPIFRLEFIEK